MKIVKLGFSVLACSIIAACSSGGGSGSQSSASEISNPTDNKVNTSPSSQNVSPTATNSSHTGRVSVIKSVGMNDISITDVKLTNSDLTKISVEGKEIQIVYPGIFAKNGVIWKLAIPNCSHVVGNIRIHALGLMKAGQMAMLTCSIMVTQLKRCRVVAEQLIMDT